MTHSDHRPQLTRVTQDEDPGFINQSEMFSSAKDFNDESESTQQ